MAKNNVQHPLPGLHRHIIGSGQTVIPSMALSVDYPVVPAPPKGVVREFPTVTEGGFVEILNGSGGTLDIKLLYINGDGDEILLDENSPLTTEWSSLALEGGNGGSFFLTDEDKGIFLRIVSATVAINEGEVTAYSSWNDVNGVERHVIDLGATPTGIFPDVAEGDALKLALARPAGVAASAYILNYDSVAHGSALAMSITDGVNTVPFQQVAGADANPGATGNLFSVDAGAGFPEGGNILVSDSVAVATKSPKIMIAFVRTNVSDVKTYQGGAY